MRMTMTISQGNSCALAALGEPPVRIAKKPSDHEHVLGPRRSSSSSLSFHMRVVPSSRGEK